MKKITIAEANAEDLDSILLLQKAAYQTEAELYNDYTIAPLTQTIEEMIEESKRSIILKAVIDKQIVGSVRAYEDNGICHIGRLLVDPQYQNQGIGAKLIKRIEALFHRASKFELFTGYKSSKNIYLYQKLGYKPYAYKQVNERLQFVFMEKRR